MQCETKQIETRRPAQVVKVCTKKMKLNITFYSNNSSTTSFTIEVDTAGQAVAAIEALLLAGDIKWYTEDILLESAILRELGDEKI